MTNLLRSAKSGSDWTENDLDAYNIQVELQDAAPFFQVDLMSSPSVDEETLAVREATEMAKDLNAQLVNLRRSLHQPEECTSTGC